MTFLMDVVQYEPVCNGKLNDCEMTSVMLYAFYVIFILLFCAFDFNQRLVIHHCNCELKKKEGRKDNRFLKCKVIPQNVHQTHCNKTGNTPRVHYSNVALYSEDGLDGCVLFG